MKRLCFITNWAHTHVAIARLLIAFLHICLVVSTIQLSQLLFHAGIHFSIRQAVLWAASGLIIIVLLKFRREKQQNRIIRMQLQKLRFLIAGISCTLLIAGFFSNCMSVQYNVSNNAIAAFTKAEKKAKPLYENYNDKKDFYKDLKAYYSTLSKKELRKGLRHELRNMGKISSDVETVIFAFLISIAMIAALLGIMALSCSLACNGQGALAVLVLAGGITGIIFLASYLGKLFRKDREKRKAAELKTTGM